MIRILASIVLLSCVSAQAQELDVPDGAQQTAKRSSTLDSYAVPKAAFTDGGVKTHVMEGPVVREAWRLNGLSATTLQLVVPLRDQLVAAGYDVQLDCNEAACGGFDFRFGVEVLPAPNMVVNLRDYHFLSAVKGPKDAPVSAITVLVSRTDTSAFIQIIRVGQSKPATAKAITAPADQTEITLPVAEVDLIGALKATGHVVLHDLAFQTGSSRLGTGPFETLDALAQFLKANTGLRVALVGHTDAVGSLDSNIALSKARAKSVAEVLIRDHGIPSKQVEAEGMGYLAPVASNLARQGREANRRVEVVLLSDGSSDE
jgi:OOP family OmpA-OmpF porin